jgi:Tfp pilus assembly protein PilV
MSPRPAGRRRRPVADERGSLLLEVVIAAFILVAGLSVMLGVLNDSNHLTTTSQRQQLAYSIAEQTMETMRANAYSDLGLSSLPTNTTDGNSGGPSSTNPLNPDYWVHGTSLYIENNWNSESSTMVTGVAATGEVLISGGSIAPTATTTVNGLTANIYRFITWVNDTCDYGGTNKCTAGTDAKRLTVAVSLDDKSGSTAANAQGIVKPVWLSTVVANPDAGTS